MPVTITSKVSKTFPGTLVSTDDLRVMVNQAIQLAQKAHTHPNLIHKKQWFGHAATSNSGEITSWTKKLHGYLTDGLKTLNFSCCGTEGSIASFAQYSADKVRGGKEVPTSVRYMQLNAGFRSDRYSYGEKVGSILHEITHMCIGTNDEHLGEQEAYGAHLCGTLARVKPSLALTNADNWAYYLTSYHDDLGLGGEDWKYLTEQEVEERSTGVACTIDKGVAVNMTPSGKYNSGF